MVTKLQTAAKYSYIPLSPQYAQRQTGWSGTSERRKSKKKKKAKEVGGKNANRGQRQSEKPIIRLSRSTKCMCVFLSAFEQEKDTSVRRKLMGRFH